MSSRRCTISLCVLHLVVLLLLSLGVCSCKARPIAIGVVKKQLEVPSTKAEEEASHARVLVSVSISNAKPSNENTANAAKQREPESGRKLEHHQEHDERNEVTGVAEKRIESESETKSVSWTVPHPKAGERQPGFNLDYDPPQTHPPVHN